MFRREEGKKKIEAELESLQARRQEFCTFVSMEVVEAGLATAREELASCRRNEQDAQDSCCAVCNNRNRILTHSYSGFSVFLPFLTKCAFFNRKSCSGWKENAQLRNFELKPWYRGAVETEQIEHHIRMLCL